jgi:signal transduction histidine kinase
MDVDKRIEYLRTIDLFEHFREDELREFAENMNELALRENDVLFREGAPGDDMYILLEGSLKVYKESRFITLIKPVDYIGEMAIIESKPRSATVQAITPSVLLQITMEQFHAYLSKQPESLVSLMRTLSQRIRRNTEIIAEEFEKANILIHDMKNLMSPLMFLDMLENELGDERHRRLVRVMREGRDNLAQMMEEALANAKRLYRPRLYVEEPLEKLLAEVVESEMAGHPDLREHRIVTDIRSPGVLVRFCRLEIRRVLINLILNAAQASPAGSEIEVSLEADDAWARVSVRDHGSGIPAHFREKVYETHFTTKARGSGLGLASCRQVVEKLHNGRISFADADGGGTVFTFALPLDRAQS